MSKFDEFFQMRNDDSRDLIAQLLRITEVYRNITNLVDHLTNLVILLDLLADPPVTRGLDYSDYICRSRRSEVDCAARLDISKIVNGVVE